jgi:hypothetical protein
VERGAEISPAAGGYRLKRRADVPVNRMRAGDVTTYELPRQSLNLDGNTHPGASGNRMRRAAATLRARK